MKLKKLLALTLSMAMIFTSFTVPALADEIVESVEAVEEVATEEVVIEEVTEAATEVEETTEITEAEEVVTEEEVEAAKAEDTEGSTYTVATGNDLIRFLTTKDKYALSKDNKDKMVTFVLSNDIEVSANKIAIPADRYITIDLNGYDLKKSVVDSDKPIVLGNDGDKYAMLVIESSVWAYDVDPDPDNETWDYPEIDLDFDVAGGEKDKALLEIGRNVNYYGKATAKSGIIKVDDGAEVEVNGQILSTTDKDDVNIQGSVIGLISGNNITLANASIWGAGKVYSTGNLLIRGNTENYGNIIVASGKATIAADNKKSEVGVITIKAADVVMESGRATQIELDDPKATFTMNGGRVDCSGDVDCYAIQEGLNGAGALKNVKLIGGVVAGYEHAMVDKKKYIINGVESDTEDIATVGEIADFSDLKKAVNNGGNYVLVDEVYAGDFDDDIEINKNLTITGTPNYSIYGLDQQIIVASNVTFTTNVNIYSSVVDGLIDVSAENAKLVMLGGTIATDKGNAIVDGADFTKDKALKNVEIYGGTICGEGGFNRLDSDTDETNCAIIDKNDKPYKDAAARLVAGEPYVTGHVDINFKDGMDMDYILMMGDDKHKAVDLDEIFDPVAYGVSEASVSYNCVFADGSKKFAGMEITGSFAENNGKITYDGKGNGATKLICNVSYNEKVLASKYVVIESSSEKNLDALAERYNATLVKTVDTMNAYEKAHKIYFDFHLDSSEAGLLGSSYELFKPKYASIDVPKGSRFSYYFEQNPVNGLYDVKYDTDKGMYYVELKNQTTSGTPTSTKVAEDRISSFSGLNIRLQFFEAGSREPLFTVPMTKYAYQRAIPESAKGENKEQALTLNIDQKAPSLTLKEGAMLTINAAFDGTRDGYWVEYPELEDADSNSTYVTPGYITAGEIYDMTNEDFEVDWATNNGIFMRQKTGSFNYNGVVFYYTGEADEKGKNDTLRVRVAYEDYVGDYALTVPVKVVKTLPQPTLKKSSFSVVKGSAIANIPLTFTSSDADSVGGITRVEVVSGRKVFTVTQSYENVKSVNDKSFTLDGYLLNIAGISDKNATAKLKVYFDNCKPSAGKVYTKTYDIKVKTVDEKKMKVKASSKDVLNLVATGTSSAEYTVTTNPEYYASADISVSVNAYAKGSKSPVAAPWLSVSKLVDGKVTVTADNPAANASSIKNIKLEFKLGSAAKPTYVKVKTNAKAASVRKSNVIVTMKLGQEFIKEYNNGKLKVDNTAIKMAKTVNYKANNLTFASVSGNDANLFRVKDVVAGKSVKIIPRLDALKAGLIEAGKEYKFDLDLKELGTGKLTDKKINVTVKVAAIKENKVKAVIDTEDVSLSTAAANGSAKFVIKTIQPYYGMKISEITIDSKTKNADKYVIEAVNAGSGFTAYGTEDGKTNSEFRIAFKDGKAPVVKNKLLKGAQKLTLIVKYENGLTAKVPLLVNIDVEPKAVAEEETAKAKKK